MIEKQIEKFNPDWVSSPGDTILDLLEERDWSQAEFATRSGYTRKHVNQLVNGSVAISDDAALRLERVLGSTAIFWLSREARYREALARQQELTELRSQSNWLQELPLRHMLKYRWVQKFSDKGQQVAECLRFFEVASIDAWREQYEKPLAAFKSSDTHKKKFGPVAAWLKTCERQAANIECQPFDTKGFRRVLKEIRSLTSTTDPEVFVPQLVELCAGVGVAVVLVPAPTGCPVTGATRWLSPNKALLMLSLRHKSNDHLWFAFFHEAGHLLLHGKKLLFIESKDRIDDEMEREADRFAQDQLISPNAAKSLELLGNNGLAIVEFANEIGIAPGIVVGRLQKHYGLPWNSRLNTLKKRYQWKE